MAESPSLRLGIDIGGTFTDLVVTDSLGRPLTAIKTLTIHRQPAEGVRNGLTELARRGVDLANVDYFVHGTTLGVNAIIARTGAKTALIVTEGFRDILEIGRLRLPQPWSFHSRRPRPLVSRSHVITVRERIGPKGETLQRLTPDEIDRVVDEILDLDVESIAICLLHSYANPTHEQLIGERLRRRACGLAVSVSSEVWPQLREYERCLLAVMNAYVEPLMDSYLSELSKTLDSFGVAATPYIARSNGGIMRLEGASRASVRTLMSGPAVGVVAAVQAAETTGASHAITLDIGGTSADVALIESGQIPVSTEQHIEEFPVIQPSVAISSIGAGGGSIAWTDPAGVLKVGPASAGSDPGPACYGRGGTSPTLTDALVVAGYIGETGDDAEVTIRRDLADGALRPLADSMNMGCNETAEAIIEVALANMLAELSGVIERRGIDPSEFSIVAYGGGGPVLAGMVAEPLGIGQVVVPVGASTLCARGAVVADAMSDFVATLSLVLDSSSSGSHVRDAAASLSNEAERWLEDEAPVESSTRLEWSAEIRYVGQSHELHVPLDEEWLQRGSIEHMSAAFHRQHTRRYGHSDEEAPVELIHLRVRAIGVLPSANLPTSDLDPGNGMDPDASRTLRYHGSAVDAALFDRARLRPGALARGPALIEGAQTVIVVPPGWSGEVTATGAIVLTHDAERSRS